MTLAGLRLPELSAYDPPMAEEGGLDPMGLAAISDRLADRLVPGIRSRMQRVRFVTAMAVGATACEELADELPADGRSTPAIAFEWLVVEGFVRRIGASAMPAAVPGSQKARAVVNRGERLSSSTYLKGPAVFGFNGVYKPFAQDAGVVDRDLAPGPEAVRLTWAWETAHGFDGFTDAVSSSAGGVLRRQIRDQVRAALRAGRCVTPAGSWLFGRLVGSLNPADAGVGERRELRTLLVDRKHENRAELASLLASVEDGLFEAQMLEAVRPKCSSSLGAVVDAVRAFERFAALADGAFRTLCAASHAQGTQAITPALVERHPFIGECSKQLPAAYQEAVTRMEVIGTADWLGDRFQELVEPRSSVDLVEALLTHHERVQAAKTPTGKRSWFELHRGGWVVRPPYATAVQPQLGPWFVHPVRVAALKRFLDQTVS